MIALLLSAPLVAQYKLNKEQSTCTVNGTSTLHDWEMTAENMYGYGHLDIEGGELKNIDVLKFTVPVKSLKSGKNRMDKNTYEALKSDKHPKISYELVDVLSMEKNGNGVDIKAKGKLTIAGVTKYIDLNVKAYNEGGGIAFKGSTTFNMTSYKVDPPVALLGTVKTGDEVTIVFNAKYFN